MALLKPAGRGGVSRPAGRSAGSLFQRPPTTDEEIQQNKPLAIPPQEVARMEEREWYQRAFRGHAAVQLTIRAIVMGCVLGFFLAFTNVYVGLKTG